METSKRRHGWDRWKGTAEEVVAIAARVADLTNGGGDSIFGAFVEDRSRKVDFGSPQALQAGTTARELLDATRVAAYGRRPNGDYLSVNWYPRDSSVVVFLVVESKDSVWVAGVFDEVKGLLDKGRRRIQRRIGIPISGVVSIATVIWAGTALILSTSTFSPHTRALIGLGANSVVVAFLA